MRIHLLTAESPESKRLRHWRLSQFPQLTMPPLAALTPREHEVFHTDETVEPVRFDRPADADWVLEVRVAWWPETLFFVPAAQDAEVLWRERRRQGARLDGEGAPRPAGGPRLAAENLRVIMIARRDFGGEVVQAQPRRDREPGGVTPR